MKRETLNLPGPIVLVPAKGIAADPQRRGFDGVPLHEVLDDLRRLAAGGMLAARVREEKNQLFLHTERHEIGLYPTNRDDAYRISHIAPITFAGQRRLIECALLLSMPDVGLLWSFVNAAPLPPNHWSLILRAWVNLARRPGPDPATPGTGLPAHHEEYLDLVSEVIEAGRRIEVERREAVPPVTYRRRSSAREERHTGRDVYSFELTDPKSVEVGAQVLVDEKTELRGQVIRVQDGWASVRFVGRVDYNDIPAQGALKVLPGTTVYRAQAAAVEALRRGDAANPGLLSTLVDRRFTAYRPDETIDPAMPLDQSQIQALRRAVSVPDQLLVLGPPGTGKTRVITEICVASAQRGQKVLLTTQTNRALDNVLERMPPEVLAVRVGSEDRTANEVRGLLVEARTKEVRMRIIGALTATQASLAPFVGDQPLLRWNAHLGEQFQAAAEADAAARHLAEARSAAARNVVAPLAGSLRAAQAAVDSRRTQVGRAESALERARARLSTPRSNPPMLLPAFVVGWLSRRRAAQVERCGDDLSRARTEWECAGAELASVTVQADQLIAADPETTRLAAGEQTARDETATAIQECSRATQILGTALSLLNPPIVVPVPPNGPDIDGWSTHRRVLDDAVRIAGRRARILADWSERVQAAQDTLHDELVRYADVVAATCTGSATAHVLFGLEFDLALVDEAGQISTPNLLMPLVRARRSVLVGDHKQLPPFRDDEVQGWADNLVADDPIDAARVQTIEKLLRLSTFEQLYHSGQGGEEHRVMLNVQRRMPSVLGNFVSGAFYQDALRTVHPGSRSDPVFTSPFAVVDTSDQPENRRREKRRTASEEWMQAGYVNHLEAEVIAGIVAERIDAYQDWAVILPYRAQVTEVSRALARRLGGPRTSGHVGTVDSFQGGERDLVVYGFTRSNRNGNVGFLSELRRINVAITRARRQLVVVGDIPFLCGAQDEAFATLLRSLSDYVAVHGDRRPSLSVGLPDVGLTDPSSDGNAWR